MLIKSDLDTIFHTPVFFFKILHLIPHIGQNNNDILTKVWTQICDQISYCYNHYTKETPLVEENFK